MKMNETFHVKYLSINKNNITLNVVFIYNITLIFKNVKCLSLVII